MEVQKWYVVDGVHYQSQKHYQEVLTQTAALQEMVAKSPDKYPSCQFGDQWDTSCDCARSAILFLEHSQGVPHDVAVSIAAIEQATMIRQYDFDGHDTSFDDFQDKFVESPDTQDAPVDPPYVQWVAENQPAVQWAIDFADLRQYL